MPVGESAFGANGRKSKLYTISDLERAYALAKIPVPPPKDVEACTLIEFATKSGFNQSTVTRHVKNENLKPVGSRPTKNGRPVALYILSELEELATHFNAQSGWSPAHEKTVRKHPMPEHDKVCTGCGIKKHYTAFKRYTRGRYLKCEECRNAEKSFQPPVVGLDNKLCSAFLRGAL